MSFHAQSLKYLRAAGAREKRLLQWNPWRDNAGPPEVVASMWHCASDMGLMSEHHAWRDVAVSSSYCLVEVSSLESKSSKCLQDNRQLVVIGRALSCVVHGS